MTQSPCFTFEDVQKYGLEAAPLVSFLRKIEPPGWASIDTISMNLDPLSSVSPGCVTKILHHLEPFNILEIHTLNDCIYPCCLCTSIRLKPNYNQNNNKEI